MLNVFLSSRIYNLTSCVNLYLFPCISNAISYALSDLPLNGNVQHRIAVTVEDDLERIIENPEDVAQNVVASTGATAVVNPSVATAESNTISNASANVNQPAAVGVSSAPVAAVDADNVDDLAGFDDAQDQNCGPDQGGASGIPLEEQDDMVEDYIQQPVNARYDEVQKLKEVFNLTNTDDNFADSTRSFFSQGDNPIINWPKQASKPVSDYDFTGIQSYAFPFLFHNQKGDITQGDREIKISKREAAQHLLWYAVKKVDKHGKEIPGYYYPFASHSRWPYWVQNTIERHRVLSQKNIYLDRNPEDKTMTAEDVQKIIETNDTDKIRGMVARMQMFSANITGSDAYFSKHRKELEACMDHKKMATVWYTFSMADNHWYDLHLLSGEEHKGNESEKAKKRRKWVRENQHIVDIYFCLRVQAMLKLFLGKHFSVTTIWKWMRYEYQNRGSIHGHGCARLGSDPGLIHLARQVVNGKYAQRILSVFPDLKERYVDPLLPSQCFHLSEVKEDEWLPLRGGIFPLRREQVDDHGEAVLGSYNHLVNLIITGKEAATKIINYNDYIVTTFHPDPPQDASVNRRFLFGNRISSFEQQSHNQHPSNVNMFEVKNEEETEDHYCDLMNSVQRHIHRKYCNPKFVKPKHDNDLFVQDENNRHCRGAFPRSIVKYTKIMVRETATGRRILELVTRCNDGWLNPHNRPLFESHKANMDFRLIIDVGKVLNYMTKYVTKTETAPNNRSKRMLMAMFKRITAGNPSIDKILSKLMSQVSVYPVVCIIVC